MCDCFMVVLLLCIYYCARNYVIDGLFDKSLSCSKDFNDNNETIKSYEVTF